MLMERGMLFDHLGNRISFSDQIATGEKTKCFNYINSTICRNLINKMRNENLKRFYKIMSLASVIYSSKTRTTAVDERRVVPQKRKIAENLKEQVRE